MQFIDLLFTLANFFVFVGAIALILRSYRRTATQEIIAEHEQHKNLVNACADLKKKLRAVELAQEQRVLLGKDLTKKVAQWKQNFDERQKIAEARRHARREVLVVRHKDQAALRQVQRVAARVIPHAVAQARLELYEMFHGSEAERGAAYVEHIVNQIAHE